MYDFTAAINAAKAVVEGSSNSEGGEKSYKYPLVYPQQGETLVVRPLFNPASGQILRLVNRHERVACYRTYGMECPICKVMQQVKDTTGQDPFGRTKSSRSRGLCFAQYISSTNVLKKSESQTIQQGEYILFMFPWSVYQQINAMIQAIAQTPTGMDQAFGHAQSGLYIQISVSNDGNFKYTTTQIPYMTFPTNMTDEDFMKNLDAMDSLYEQVLPSTITEEVSKQVTEYEQEIYKQYIQPRVPNMGVPAGTAPQQFSQFVPPMNQAPYAQNAGQQPFIPVGMSSPMNPAVTAASNAYPATTGSLMTNPVPTPVQAPMSTPAPAPAYSTPTTIPPVNFANGDNHPSCFGQHQDKNPQCTLCPDELLCIEKQSNK